MRNSGLLMTFTTCILVATGARAGEESIQLKEGTGRDVTGARCSVCHSLDYISMVAPVMNRAAWEKSVRKMIDTFGAPVDEQDAGHIIDYLAAQYSSAEAGK
jgi:cytochrome c5